MAGSAATGTVEVSDLSVLPDAAVLERLRLVEQQARQLHMHSLAAIGEIASRGLAPQAGFTTTQGLVAQMLQLPTGQARARVDEAGQLAARVSVTGERLQPQLPSTAEALAQGSIGATQVGIIVRAMAALPATIDVEQRDWAEQHLACHAQLLAPSGLSRLARRITDHLDPDGPEPDTELAAAPSGSLRLHDRRNGGVAIEGWLGVEDGPAFRALIDQLSPPRPAGENLPDPRGREERQADALVEMCALARSAEHSPHAGGEPPHVSVTLSLADLIAGLGRACVDNGRWLDPQIARRWACEAKILPLVLGGDSEPLDIGRAARTVPTGIRRALIARDGGCVFPGCDRPPSLCQAHHIRHWADGGETALRNLCLLCQHHHRHIHHTGWDVTTSGGQVWLTPPALLDPHRQPRTNPLLE